MASMSNPIWHSYTISTCPTFTRTPAGYVVADAGSLNGTYLNRERIESAALANGDEVQIGKFRLLFFTSVAGGAQ